jgi:hypothetical protein
MPIKIRDLAVSLIERRIKPRHAFVYIIELAGGKFYIGSTMNILGRLGQHLTDYPAARLWGLIEVAPIQRKEIEARTIRLASAQGWPLSNQAHVSSRVLLEPEEASRLTRIILQATREAPREQLPAWIDALSKIRKMTP